jgi:hypothetical protein
VAALMFSISIGRHTRFSSVQRRNAISAIPWK